jgi:antitoxin CptB
MTSPGESGLLAFGNPMSDLHPSDSETRKKRILFRAWHRGTREMDLLLGRFTEKFISGFGDAELVSLESLVECPDPDIYNWIIGAAPVPAEFDTPLLHDIRKFHMGGETA